VPVALYERWYIDLTGPHPRSDRGNIYILACMDSFTKWTEAFAIRNKKIKTIARVLVEQVFNRFGTPLSIVSAQGREVDGRIMTEVCNMFGITKLQTTPYTPFAKQVKRFHRTMNSILAKTVSDHHRDWDSHLSFASAAFRATRHDSTGYTPNFLVLGREVRAPSDIVYGNPEDDKLKTVYVDKLKTYEGKSPKRWTLPISTNHSSGEVESVENSGSVSEFNVIEDSGSIFEVYEPSAKASPTRRLASSPMSSVSGFDEAKIMRLPIRIP